MSRVVAALGSPLVKWLFLAVALGLGIWAIAANYEAIFEAVSSMPWYLVFASFAATTVSVGCTLFSWRRLLNGLGASISLRPATSMFGVSQLGKYIPGGVWNIIAATEIGARHNIARRTSFAAMAVAILISLVSGLAVGCMAFVLSPTSAIAQWAWLAAFAPLFMILLVPPLLNRLIALAFRIVGRPPLDHPFAMSDLLTSAAWALGGWVFGGVQVWLLMFALGVDPTGRNLLLAMSGYALAWVAGYLIIFAPAGVGVREAVLAAVLAGSLSGAEVLTLVLVSRALFTVVDLALALIGLQLSRTAHPPSLPTTSPHVSQSTDE